MERSLARFTLATPEPTLGEPVLVDFSVHNGLSEIIRFDLGHNLKSNFELSVTQPDGATIPVPRLSNEGLGLIGRMSLSPGQEYTQRLVLNEWYHFSAPGDYVVQIRLASPLTAETGTVVDSGPSSTLRMHVYPRDPGKLEQLCQELYDRSAGAASVEEAAEAALTLSYVRDPIATRYLEQGLREGHLSWQHAIPGLGRIANREAVDALISIMKTGDAESGSALARWVLEELVENIPDSTLQEVIRSELQSE